MHQITWSKTQATAQKFRIKDNIWINKSPLQSLFNLPADFLPINCNRSSYNLQLFSNNMKKKGWLCIGVLVMLKLLASAHYTCLQNANCFILHSSLSLSLLFIFPPHSFHSYSLVTALCFEQAFHLTYHRQLSKVQIFSSQVPSLDLSVSFLPPHWFVCEFCASWVWFLLIFQVGFLGRVWIPLLWGGCILSLFKCLEIINPQTVPLYLVKIKNLG